MTDLTAAEIHDYMRRNKLLFSAATLIRSFFRRNESEEKHEQTAARYNIMMGCPQPEACGIIDLLDAEKYLVEFFATPHEFHQLEGAQEHWKTVQTALSAFRATGIVDSPPGVAVCLNSVSPKKAIPVPKKEEEASVMQGKKRKQTAKPAPKHGKKGKK